MKESKFQAKLIRDIRDRLPGAVVVKNDPSYLQGVPDLTVFWEDRWAWLECKKSRDAEHRPNQDYYISWANQNSFGRFVSPENREEVLDELERSFKAGGAARLSQREQVPLDQL